MGGYCAGICGHLRSCGRSESEKHGGFSNILAQGSPPRHYSGFSISSTQSKTFFEVMWSLFRCPRLFKKSTETHLIWSSLVTFTKIQFHRVREFEAKSKTCVPLVPFVFSNNGTNEKVPYYYHQHWNSVLCPQHLGIGDL